MVRAHVSPWRFRVLTLIFAAAALLLVLRLVQVQILSHQDFEAQARDIHFWTQTVEGPRGAILDRNGFPLVTGIDTFEIHIDRQAWELDQGNERFAIQQLSRLLGVTEEQVRAIVESGSGRDVLLALNVPYSLGERVIADGLPGVRVTASNLRRYAEGDLASQVLGFVGRDNNGLAGIEYDFDAILSGEPGRYVYERDSIGNPIPFGAQAVDPIQPGADIVLTIDRTLQRIAEDHLARALADTGASGGTILIMDPHTGDILAMASEPSFDVTDLDLTDPNLDFSLFRNRAVTDLYEPGSVFKVITMSAALDAGLVNPNTTFLDTGAIVVGARTIRNFDLSFHGQQTMTQVLQRSLNPGTAWVATTLGTDLFYWYLSQFGFGEVTNAGFAGEAPGIVKEPGNLFWSEVDLATNSFGQGISVTPLQIVRAYSVIANGGELVRPRLIRAIITDDGVRVVPVVIERRVLREETARTMWRMMQAVVDGVDGHPAQVTGWPIAGKSGTSDVAEDGAYLEGEFIASFAGFAPADDPRVVVLVKIDRPQGETEYERFGGVVAAPIYAALMEDILPYLGSPPTTYVATPSLFDAVLEETGTAEAKESRAEEAAAEDDDLAEFSEGAFGGDFEVAKPVDPDDEAQGVRG
ncbi:MAG: penicillin-binding protein 2 [Chloroflexi bacterium]|nr:penicillin-binding protein 2 [Chloroflexota bacterium]